MGSTAGATIAPVKLASAVSVLIAAVLPVALEAFGQSPGGGAAVRSAPPNVGTSRAAATPAASGCNASAAECGRRAFDSGVAAYEKGDYPTALALFQQAYQFRPHPAIAFNLALAEVHNALVIEGVARMDQVIADSRTSAQLRERVKAERAAAIRQIASIRLDVVDPEHVQASIDDRPIPDVSQRQPVNPGQHTVRLVESGRSAIERVVNIAAGETLLVTVDRSRQIEVFGAITRKAETLVIGRVADQQHRSMPQFARGKQAVADHPPAEPA